MKDILVTPKEAAAAHKRVQQLAREGRVDDLILELRNPYRFRLLVTRGSAASCLGKLGARSAAGPVAELLDDPAPDVRQAAARALGRMGVCTDQIRKKLVRVIDRDEDDDVRAAALSSLGELSDPLVMEYVRPFLEVSSAAVRVSAIYALLLSDDPIAVDLGRESLRSEKWYMWPYRRRLAKDLRNFRRDRLRRDRRAA